MINICKKFSKKEIEKLFSYIPKKIIIHEYTEYEKFKQIKIHNEYAPYFISSCGRIFSINDNNQKYTGLRELKSHINKTGYNEIRITYNKCRYSFLIHVLVAKAFVKNKDKSENIVVNHLDGIKTNNIYLNLEWTTYSGNTQHAIKSGLFIHAKGEQVGTSKYSEEEIIEVCEMLQQNISLKNIVKNTRLTYSAVTNILYKRTWFHIVYKFDFSNYEYGKDKKSRNKMVQELCQLASTGKYTVLQLSEKTGINRRTVYDILKGKTHKNISSNYDLSKYQN